MNKSHSDLQRYSLLHYVTYDWPCKASDWQASLLLKSVMNCDSFLVYFCILSGAANYIYNFARDLPFTEMMRLITLTLLLSAFLVLSTEARRPFYRNLWNTWKQVYKKSYASLREDNLRMRIFSNNFNFIRWHNEKFFNGEVSYYVGLNSFADLTLKEFADAYLSLQQTSIDNEFWDVQLLREFPWKPVPNYIDWRKKGYVTPVKDQVRNVTDNLYY